MNAFQLGEIYELKVQAAVTSTSRARVYRVTKMNTCIQVSSYGDDWGTRC